MIKADLANFIIASAASFAFGVWQQDIFAGLFFFVLTALLAK